MKAILEYTVKAQDAGKTVETIFRKNFGVSGQLMKFLKMNGRLRCKDKILRSVDTVSAGDFITADVTENEPSENIVPKKMPLDILYEDEFLLVVNKPRNLSVHPSINHFSDSLANGVMYYYRETDTAHKFHAVNRIDKDTSGICVIAKNSFTHAVLSEQMKDKRFFRKYVAIVNGIIPNKSGVISKPIRRGTDGIIKRVVAKDGKEAITIYNVLKENNGFSLIDILLKTGRTHQIRVHFSDMGYPLVGDWLYGNGDEERTIAPNGHLLLSYYAEFYHPKTKKLIKITAPLPEDMKFV